MASDDLPKTVDVLFNRFPTWFDERLEAEKFPSSSARVSAAHRVLSDVEAEEIETRDAVDFLKSMSNAGFTGF